MIKDYLEKVGWEFTEVEEIHPMADPLCGNTGKHPARHLADEYHLNRGILEDPQRQNTASIQAA